MQDNGRPTAFPTRAVAKGDVAAAEKAYRDAASAVDKTAASSTMHRNTASRRKSLMARRLKAMQGGGAATAAKPAKPAKGAKSTGGLLSEAAKKAERGVVEAVRSVVGKKSTKEKRSGSK